MNFPMLKNMCKIYVYMAKIADFLDNTNLPPFAEEEIAKITNQNVINQKKSTFGLLKKAVKEVFDFDDDFKHIEKTKNGKPISSKYFLSISHSKNVVAVAIASENIGIDVEMIDEKKDFNKLKKYILNKNETMISSIEELTSLWTKKEAKFKFYGGERFIPKNINTLDFDAKSFQFVNKGAKYILSVVADNLEKINIVNLI